MAEDIAIIWDNDTFEGDIEYNNGDLIRESGLKTAVLMSSDSCDRNGGGITRKNHTWSADVIQLGEDIKLQAFVFNDCFHNIVCSFKGL